MKNREPIAYDDDPTIGALVADASRDVSTLIQSEIKLAKAELSVSLKAGGVGAAIFAVAAFLLLLSLIFASFAIAYFIAMTGLDLAWCFLIVFGGYVVLAILLLIIGFVMMKKIKSPQRTIAQAKQLPGVFKPS